MYMYNLTKVNDGFEEMKKVRSKIESDFATIHSKLKMLRKIYSEVVSKHKKIECTLGVDALFFQSELIDKEYSNLQSLFLFINNRIYCEYYKLFYYIKDYVESNMEKDIVEDVKMDVSFPAYKSLSNDIEYDFGDIIKMQSQIVNTLDKLEKYCSENVSTNNEEKALLKMGLHIDTVIHTQDYMNSILKVKLKMFFQYLETFNTHQHKHLTRLLKKTEMILDIINDDMPLHESSDNSDTHNDKDKQKKEHTTKPTNSDSDTHTQNTPEKPSDSIKHTNKLDVNDSETYVKENEMNEENTEISVKNTPNLKNELDTSGDATKFAKSVVNADNINFTVNS